LRNPDETTTMKQVDWDGKLALIEASRVADIKHFIFCSVLNLEQFLDIPLMQMKKGIEVKLKESHIPFTIFRLTGFYQGLIGQYAIPILENQPIWITTENTRVSYMDTQDIARFCLRALQLPDTQSKTFFLGGPKAWLSSEIITLCEQLAGQTAKIQRIPLPLLQVSKYLLNFFEWGQNINDRLAFVEILNVENNFSKLTFDLYKTFKISKEKVTKLDNYFQDYFIKMLKRLKDINFEDVQRQKNLIL